MRRRDHRLFFLIIMGAAVLLQCEAGIAKEQFTMGTTNSSSSHYTYFVSVAQVINAAVPEVQITAVESGAARENAQRIVKGSFDLGLSDTVTSYVAYNGLEDWKGKPYKDFRWLWTYAPAPIMFLVRQDSGVKDLHELTGKSFAPAQVGSSAGKITANVFKALGIKPKFYRGSYSDAGQAVENRQIIGMAKPSAGLKNPDGLIMKVQASVPLTFLSLSKEDLQKIASQFPYYIQLKFAKNVYKNQPKDITTVGFAAGCIARANLSADLAYKIVKAVIDGQKTVSGAYPAVKDIDYIQTTLDTATIPLHVGVVKYFEERGVKVPQRLLPPEYTK